MQLARHVYTLLSRSLLIVETAQDKSNSRQTQLLRFLMMPLLPQNPNLKPTSLRPPHNRLRLLRNGHINHLPIQRPRSPPSPRRLLIRNTNPNRPNNLVLLRPKDPLHSVHLRRMDTLLPIKPQILPPSTLLLQRRRRAAVLAFIRRTDEVNSGRQLGRAGRRRDRGPREEKLR